MPNKVELNSKENLEKKWGTSSLDLGWTAIPTALLFLQSELKISTLGMNILLNLIMHWWERDERPYPSQESIAKRMGVSKRSVQREIAKLCESGLIEKTPSAVTDPNYRGRNTYDLTALARRINAEAPVLKEKILDRKLKR